MTDSPSSKPFSTPLDALPAKAQSPSPSTDLVADAPSAPASPASQPLPVAQASLPPTPTDVDPMQGWLPTQASTYAVGSTPIVDATIGSQGTSRLTQAHLRPLAPSTTEPPSSALPGELGVQVAVDPAVSQGSLDPVSGSTWWSTDPIPARRGGSQPLVRTPSQNPGKVAATPPAHVNWWDNPIPPMTWGSTVADGCGCQREGSTWSTDSDGANSPPGSWDDPRQLSPLVREASPYSTPQYAPFPISIFDHPPLMFNPTVSASGTSMISVLAGHGVKSSDDVNIYGLDLGFTAYINGVTHFFFGDTWSKLLYDKNPNHTPLHGPLGLPQPFYANGMITNNDSFATTTDLPSVNQNPTLVFASMPAPGISSSQINYDSSNPFPHDTLGSTTDINGYSSNIDLSITFTYIPIQVFDQSYNGISLPLGDGLTPASAFATTNAVYTVVKGYIPPVDPNPAVALMIAKHTEYAASGIFHTVGPFIQLPNVFPISISFLNCAFFSYVPTNNTSPCYSSGLTSLSIEVIADGKNSTLYTQKTINHPVYVWGRPSYSAISTKAASNNPEDLVPGATALYLAVFDGDMLDAGVLNSKIYYLTESTSENPRWSENQADARPVFSKDGLTPVDGSSPEILFINQMTATYDENLCLWILLYGGGLPGQTPGGVIVPNTYFFPSTDVKNSLGLPTRQTISTGIHIRCSVNPWGPWSDPIKIYSEYDDPDSCKIFYNSDVTGCVLPDSSVVGQGAPYGASIWQGASVAEKPGTQTTMYFMMSTWNPYHVVLMKTTLTKN